MVALRWWEMGTTQVGFPGTDSSDRPLLQQCGGAGGAENNVCLVGLEAVPEQNIGPSPRNP